MTVQVHHLNNSRSQRILWLLEELGAPYESKLVSTRSRDGTGAVDPANPHPHGKVPAIRHDGEMVFEAAAIAAYLTDAFPKNRIGPLAGEPGRGAYLSWLAYAAGVIEPGWTCKYLAVDVPPGTAGWPPSDEAMAHVVTALERGPYILGERFSAVDILLAPRFAVFLGMGLAMVPNTPAMEAYVKRMMERPAYARAQARDRG